MNVKIIKLQKIFLLLWGIGMVYQPLSAQDNIKTLDKISIASPTAASLGKFGDIPVSYHTGIPQINIPIYTIEAGPLKLPVSLSYHASGIKVQETSSWVGAGWALNAGGVITRTVVGAPDEKNTGTSGIQTHGHFSDYGFNSYLYQSGIEDWQNFARGAKDGEPDLYFFNFGSYSGKFYFRDDRTPIILPETDFRIVPTYTGSGSIESFVITTPDGVQYFFGSNSTSGGAQPVERTNSITSQNGMTTANVISSWFLNRVTSPDGQFTISLVYEAENYGFFTVSMFPIDPAAINHDMIGEQIEYNLVKNIMQGVRLSQINFPNGAVNFVANTVREDLSSNNPILYDDPNETAKALDRIEISNNNGYCKKFRFAYSYFVDDFSPGNGYFQTQGAFNYNLSSDRKRLKLDTLSQSSCDLSQTVPPYQFIYFSEPVPRRLSFGMDHWGFYNGVNTNQTLIPTYTVNNGTTVTTFTGAARDAAWPAMRGGALQKIIYPTGGNTVFDFEANETYTNYSVNQLNNVVGMSLGYDGGISTTNTFVANSIPYQIGLVNTSINAGVLTIYDSSNVIVYSTGVNANGTNTLYNVQLAPGTYHSTLTLSSGGNPNPLGTGVQVNFAQWGYVTVRGNQLVGGLRIKTITNQDDNTSVNTVTSYTYRDNDRSTGILYGKPVYVSIVRNDLIGKLGYWHPDGDGGYFTPYLTVYGCVTAINASYYKSPSSIRPMANTQGNHIGYSSVKVSQTGNGYSKYEYFGTPPWEVNQEDVAVRTVNTAGCNSNAPNYPPAPLPYDFMRGELKRETHFHENGRLLKEVNYLPTYVKSSFSTPGFIVVTYAYSFLGTRYELFSAHKTQSRTEEIVYSPEGSPVRKVTNTFYESPYHHEATRVTTESSTGDLIENKQKYAFDYQAPAVASIADGAAQYNTSCAACQATYFNSTPACGYNPATNAGCLINAYRVFLQCQNTARVNYVAYQRLKFTDADNFLKTKHNEAKTAADASLRPIYELQDMYNNASVEVSSWKKGNLLKAGFTKYDYISTPSTVVYPIKTRAINLSAPSPTFTPSVVGGNSLTSDSRYADETSLVFSAGNLSGITKRDGVQESYLYDYNKQYPVAKIINASATQAAFSSFESDGTGNWIYNSANTIADNMAITGKKAYPLSTAGITSNSLNNNLDYIVTYWLKDGSGTAAVNGTGGTAMIGRQGWHLIQATVTGVTGVTVSGSGTIDELRLYPKNAQMETFTYDPLLGLTGQCDINNKIMYYQYDALGRLKSVRDPDGNIIKTYNYNYKQ